MIAEILAIIGMICVSYLCGVAVRCLWKHGDCE